MTVKVINLTAERQPAHPVSLPAPTGRAATSSTSRRLLCSIHGVYDR
ncbi:hypothetical protein [Streptomyces sp. NPDC001714]